MIAIIAVAFFTGTIVTSVPVQNVVAANPTLTDLFSAVGLIKAKTDNLPADPASNTEVDTRASQASINALHNQNTELLNSIASVNNKVANLPLGQIIVIKKVTNGPDGTYQFFSNATAPFNITTSGGVGTMYLNGLTPNQGILLRESTSDLPIGSINNFECVNIKGNSFIDIDTSDVLVTLSLESSSSVVRCTWTTVFP